MAKAGIHLPVVLKLGLFMQLVITIQRADAMAAQTKHVTDSSTYVGLATPPTSLPGSLFLIISSPGTKKVVYTALASDGTSKSGRTYSLISNGLEGPMGIALNRKTGHLFVADAMKPAIYRYNIRAEVSGSSTQLVEDGTRVTILDGHPVEWLTLDDAGSIFYTAPDTNNINKIDVQVIDKLALNEMKPESLKFVSEKKLEAMTAVAAATATNSTDGLVGDPSVQPEILSLYEAKANPWVSKPAAVYADGHDLFWTNTDNGNTVGTIVRGEVDPQLVANSSSGPAHYLAYPITQAEAEANGVAKAKTLMFFSHPSLGGGSVSVIQLSSGTVLPAIVGLKKPSALVYDGDGTVYVADEVANAVYSFPSGRFMANVPLTNTVTQLGASGLALLSSSDPCFGANSVNVDQAGAAHNDNIAHSVKTDDRTALFLQGILDKASSPRARNWMPIMLATLAVSSLGVAC